MTQIACSSAILAAAKHEVGVREEGANNHGKQVEVFQTHDSLPGGGYAWCNDFTNFCEDVSGCHAIEAALGNTASVEQTYHSALNHGWIVDPSQKPQPGWLVIYKFSHIGVVVEWVRPGLIETIEGNTGSSGAVSDSEGGGDGVWQKYRDTSLVRGYVKTTGTVDDAQLKTFLGGNDKRIVNHTNEEAFWLWLRWDLGEGVGPNGFKKWGPANKAHRPNGLLPKPGDPIYGKEWIPRMHQFVAARNK